MIAFGKFNVPAALAEFLGMALFIFISTGSAVGVSPTAAELIGGTINYSRAAGVLVTATAFGLSITSLAFAFGPRSGAHFNPAVTVGLMLTGNLGAIQAAANIVCQILGALLGSAFVLGMYSDSDVGANALSGAQHDNKGMPFLAEAIGTFALVLVVLECCCNKTRAALAETAPIAIGFTVFIAHLVLIPYTSCSINPARTLGPAIVSGVWGDDFWVFMLGPLTGAVAAAGTHIAFEKLAITPTAAES